MNKDTIVRLRKQALEKQFSGMNDMQKKAVFCTEGPLLILAGAGSGKTTVLVNRITNIVGYGQAYTSEDLYVPAADYELVAEELTDFIEKDVPLSHETRRMLAVRAAKPWQVLAITFTNKAAGELKERICKMLGAEGEDIWASTFHSTCAKMLRRYGERIGFTSHFTIYDTDDSKRLMKECMKILQIDEKSFPIRGILNEISRSKDRLETPAEMEHRAGSDYRMQVISKAYKLYQEKLTASDAMDFDDLLINTIKLFKAAPDVLQGYQNQFRYIMIDEYQDTNHAQYVFVNMLAQKSGNLCVVGDDDQSIYKFRGATIENILGFEKDFKHCTVIRLEQNYRSTQTILDAANAVISNNNGRKGKTLWTSNGQGKPVTVHTSYNESDEANFIAKQIEDNVENGFKYSDHAILYRMNAQSNSIERVFARSGIPYRIIGGVRFYDRKEIKDMMAYLQIVSNPSDEVRMRRIINVPKRGIGDKTVSNVAEIAEGIGESMFYVINHADEFEALKRSAGKLMEFGRLLGGLIDFSNDPENSLEDLYREILDKTDYVAYLKSENDFTEERIENIDELASNLIQYEENYGEESSLYGFLEEVSLFTDIDRMDTDADAVVMMTIHSSKGLEFPFVFLPGFEEGVFPGVQSMYNPDEVEEERRLAYVAITRAKKQLFITNAKSRMIFGSTQSHMPSRFLKEIPDKLKDDTSPKAAQPKPTFQTGAAQNKGYLNEVKKLGGAKTIKPSAAVTSYAPGDRVKHNAFGIGMVLSCTPMGGDTLLEIAFETKGTKKIMATYARLKKLP